MSRINSNNPQVASIKSQYLEAQRNNDTTKMNTLKKKGMQLMKQIEKKENTESEPSVSNKDGDLLYISNEGLVAQETDTDIKKSSSISP